MVSRTRKPNYNETIEQHDNTASDTHDLRPTVWETPQGGKKCTIEIPPGGLMTTDPEECWARITCG